MNIILNNGLLVECNNIKTSLDKPDDLVISAADIENDQCIYWIKDMEGTAAAIRI